ncbi:MAG: hypothetical protein IPO91_26375 [Chloroflexi bacterium]|nr:hypothetical protein [Chloroflexota bacterium]
MKPVFLSYFSHHRSTLLGGGLMLIALIMIASAFVAPEHTLAQTGATPTPLPLYALPDARTNRAYVSSSIALATDGRTLVAANLINNTATISVPTFSEVVAEIPVGRDPRSAAITADDAHALITNRADGTLSVINMAETIVTATISLGAGTLPYAVVTDNNTTAYVSLMGSSQVARVDVVNGRVLAALDVPAAPAGLTLWGDFLYVTHFWSGELTLIYVPTWSIVRTIATGADVGVFQSIELDTTRGFGYLPQTRLNAQNLTPTYDTLAFPVVNVVDLRSLSVLSGQQIPLDVADRPVNMPFAAAVDRFNQRIYVINAGSDDLSVIDLTTGRARANLRLEANPRGVLLNRDNTRLYVHSALEGTITTITTSDLQIEDVMPIVNLTTPIDQLIGAQLFHSAVDPRLASDHQISCATCHFDGLSDGRVWLGFADGPRNTPVLYALPETVPYTWSGTWDELADVELKIRGLQAGAGLLEGEVVTADPLNLAHAGLSLDLDTLTQYLATLNAPRSPLPVDEAQVNRGAEIFAAQGCAECHVGSAGTNLQAYDVGTGASPLETHGAAFDTPTLRWLWLSAPYFHDGSAATLRQVFELPGRHQLIFTVAPADIDALVYYLQRLPR